MKDNCSALCSEYVIDGIRQPLTPARLLDAEGSCPLTEPSPIVDESIDPSPVLLFPDEEKTDGYADAIIALKDDEFPALYSAQYTRIGICRALTDILWRAGHFRMCDLTIDLDWRWNDEAIGHMAAFYAAAESAAAFLDEMALKTGDVSVVEGRPLSFKAGARLLRNSSPGESDLLEGLPFHTVGATLSKDNAVPSTVRPDPQSWVIYIPFDTCDFRLGGSALSKVMGTTCGIAPAADDTDYFQDCFEIVREMVEDGVILSGRSVRDGGLMVALRQYCPAPEGISADISDILRSRGEGVPSRVLFAEVPGVLLQIRDIDYDYFDAQMLLQDVEYFPLGHPGSSSAGVEICNSAKNGISRILEAILGAQNGEGED